MDDINNNDPRPMAAIMSHLTVEPWEEPRPQPAQWRPEWLQPASPEEITLSLSRCLTLCAPTGMSVEDRTEWLMIAADAMREIPRGLFLEACQFVGVRCDHPAKLTPAIFAYAEEHRQAWEWRSRPATSAPRLTVVRDAPPPKRPPLTQAEVDATPAHLIGIGIACGAIARDKDGRLIPAPTDDGETPE